MESATVAAPAATPATLITTIRRADLPHLGELVPAFGGVFAALMRGAGESPDFALIVPTDPRAENPAIAFGGYGKRAEGADDFTDGLANTLALVASGIDHPAAKWARSLDLDGINDFYLPARHELRACYLNVPALFSTDDYYWSSTQVAGSSGNAWSQDFGNGGQDGYNKSYEGRARAVRRLIIQ